MPVSATVSGPRPEDATRNRRRILFVDDEIMILQGLRGLLRRERRRWEMVFVDSAEAAIALLAERQFDVIITDMRMPRMDGAQLLTHVRDQHPEMVRIVLSGYADTADSLRAIPVAHQFVSKPVTPKQLRQVVTRATALHEILEDPSLRRTIGGMRQLPTLSDTYVHLCATIDAPDSSARDVAKILEQDVGAAAKVLQIVNSGFFGLEHEIRSIQKAIPYLGMDIVRSLVMLTDTIDGFAKNKVKRRVLSHIRKHALITGAIARQMFSDRQRADDAFTAGLLHDIGKLVLAALEADPTVLLPPEADHAKAGAYLLGLWGLPHTIVEAVAAHHTPWDVSRDQFGLTAALYIADHLAHATTHDLKDGPPPLDPEFIDGLGVADELSGWNGIARDLSRAPSSGA